MIDVILYNPKLAKKIFVQPKKPKKISKITPTGHTLAIQVAIQWPYILDNLVLFGIKGYHRKVVLDTGKD